MRHPGPCAEMRDALLEAEPAELHGRGDSTVARHVRACPACAGAARRILDSTRALDLWLGATPDVPAIDELLRRAGTEAGPRRLLRNPGFSWVPVAAAAAALVLLLRPSPPPSLPPGPSGGAGEAPLPVLQDAGGRSVAVLETDNPNMTLIWFF